MTGVTHFEMRSRRGGKEHPKCPFCGVVILVTPKRVYRAGGAQNMIEWWAKHVFDCVPSSFPNRCNWETALCHMAAFGATVWDNT